MGSGKLDRDGDLVFRVRAVTPGGMDQRRVQNDPWNAWKSGPDETVRDIRRMASKDHMRRGEQELIGAFRSFNHLEVRILEIKRILVKFPVSDIVSESVQFHLFDCDKVFQERFSHGRLNKLTFFQLFESLPER